MVFWKRAVISFGKARAFLEAGVYSSVFDCSLYPLGLREDVRIAKPPAPFALTSRLATAVGFSDATTPNGINQHFPRTFIFPVPAGLWQ